MAKKIMHGVFFCVQVNGAARGIRTDSAAEREKRI